MKEEIDLGQYNEQTVARRYEITGVLTNIHGEHAKRTQLISGIVFDETRTLTEGEKDKIEKRKTKSTRPEVVHTFPRDKDGYLIIPLGGKHGYIMGAIKVAILDLFKDKLKDRKWAGFGIRTYITQGVHIVPTWLRVGKKYSNTEEQPICHRVKTAGISKAMIPVYYDVVSRVEIKFTIEQMNTKIPENILLPLLAYIQRLGLGPKGRGQLKITKCVKTKGD